MAEPRRSESNTFSVPKCDRERIYCAKLLSALYGDAVVELTQCETPDFVALIGGRQVAIELAQPKLVTKPQAILRRWEEIQYESAQSAGGLANADCHVNLYIDREEEKWLLKNGFDSKELVEELQKILVKLCSIAPPQT